MGIRRLAMLVGAITLLVPTSVSAGAFVCSVRPQTYLAMSGDGVVITQVEGAGFLGVCSVAFELGGVKPDACRGWYSTLLTWREAGKAGRFYFDEASFPGVTSCSQFSNWQIKIPYYLESAQ